jgi:putative membrane protein
MVKPAPMSSEALVNPRSDRAFFAFNAVLSTVAVAFIAFILGRGKAGGGPDLSFMPAVNACFNALSASCLVAGYFAIRRKKIALHRLFMVTAFASSAVFLIGYLAYHFFHGDTKFTGVGPARALYLLLLASHVLLSLTVVPLALSSFYFAFTRSFTRHRKLNRVFLPIWLYVSVTGVLIFFILH